MAKITRYYITNIETGNRISDFKDYKLIVNEFLKLDSNKYKLEKIEFSSINNFKLNIARKKTILKPNIIKLQNNG